jgi:hypothetical protein
MLEDEMIAPATSTGQMADLSMRRWLLTESIRQSRHANAIPELRGPIVSVSCEDSAAADRVAHLVGQHWSWEVVDEVTLAYMVSRYGTPDKLSAFADSKTCSFIERAVRNWVGELGYTRSENVRRTALILWLATCRGKVVIVGKVAQAILPSHCMYSVRLTASPKPGERTVPARIKSDAYDLWLKLDTFTEGEAANLVATATRSWLRGFSIGWD